ncbi:MAG: hypothetical protein D6679_10260 [Candidatus Hydrogenedentota bacterium]|nr:MAG: hypothetical protein D6679_10260 [Candidatus Hydrogenedentota bacterium]
MKRVFAFLGFPDRITLRRLLLLEPHLRERNLEMLVCNEQNLLESAAGQEAKFLGINLSLRFVPYERPAPGTYPPGLPASPTAERLRRVHRHDSRSRKTPPSEQLHDLFTSAGIPPAELIQPFVNHCRSVFLRHYKTASLLLDQLQPDLLLFDNELCSSTRAMILAARDRRIRIVALQHGDGYGEFYRRIPVLADDVIAYGEYNRSILDAMGVPRERIHVTGAPESDFAARLDRETVRARVRKRLSIPEDTRVLLLALRPFRLPTHSQMNIRLLSQCREVLRSATTKVRVLTKFHPADYPISSNELLRRHAEVLEAFTPVPHEESLLELLAASDLFVTFKSTSVVESVLLNVPLFLVLSSDDDLWPPWETFALFPHGSPEDLASFLLNQFLSKHFPDCVNNPSDKRQAFLRHFRHAFDGLACQRIAGVLSKLAASGPTRPAIENDVEISTWSRKE